MIMPLCPWFKNLRHQIKNRMLKNLTPINNLGVAKEQKPEAGSSLFNNLLILPNNDKSILARIDGQQLIVIKDLPIKAGATWTISDNGIIAFIAGKGRRIAIDQLDDNYRTTRQSSLLLPQKRHTRIIKFIKNDILLAGGNLTSEMLGYVNCSQNPLLWQPIWVPAKITMEGKSIDDLVIDGNRLIAVDNFIIPKFLLFYDISDPFNPQFIKMKKLGTNGTYERIEKAVVNTNFIVTLSSTYGSNGSSQHISVLDKETLELKAVLSTHQKAYHGPIFRDIAVAGETIVIAADSAGVAIIDISKLINLGENQNENKRPHSKLLGIIKRWYVASCGIFIQKKGIEIKNRISSSQLKYFFPENMQQGKVFRIYIDADQLHAVCVSKNNESFSYYILSLYQNCEKT